MDDKTEEIANARAFADQMIEKFGKDLSPEARQKLENTVIGMNVNHLQAKDALGFTPQMMEEIYRVGYNFFKAGKYRDALAAFTFLRMLDITDVRYSFGVAAAYQYLHDYRNAGANYMLCNYLDPYNPLPCFHLYDCFMKTDYPMSALQALHHARILAEKDPKYEILKGKIAIELNFMNEYAKENLSKKYDAMGV